MRFPTETDGRPKERAQKIAYSRRSSLFIYGLTIHAISLEYRVIQILYFPTRYVILCI